MITLSNGDKWVIDNSEWQDAGIDYEEACKGNIPETDKRKFVERLCAYHKRGSESDEYLLPKKLIFDKTFPDGYWDFNFDVFSEVFGDLATRKFSTPWCDVYTMPWAKVLVLYYVSDEDGYNSTAYVEVYDDFDQYTTAVMGGDIW